MKLLLAGLIIAGATGYMAWLGAAASWQYYLTTDECLAQRAALGTSRIRVNGKVVPASLKIADGAPATFALLGTHANLAVVCSGPPPDNLKDGMSVVAEGRLDSDGRLQSDKVLTRCASKYQSQSGDVSARPENPGSEGGT